MQWRLMPQRLYVSIARLIAGTPAISKHTLCFVVEPMRVPLPPAMMIETMVCFMLLSERHLNCYSAQTIESFWAEFRERVAQIVQSRRITPDSVTTNGVSRRS